MPKYKVTAPLAVGHRAKRIGQRGTVTRYEPGDIVEFDESVARQLARQLEPYVEPRRREPTKPLKRYSVPQRKPEPQTISEPEADSGDEQRI